MTTKKQNSNQNSKITIDQLFNANTVRARKSAKNWQEAIRVIGQLLVDEGSVEAGYVDAMIRVVQELGPYAVLAPGIVMLHARPEDGVKKPCMGLVTLATPVNFGHTQNDPVDITLALGAVDKKSHLQALQNVAELLANPEALKDIRSAADDDALLQVIKFWTRCR